MKILKFGGKSLAPGEPLENAINIIKQEQKPVLVVSAIGDSTDRLQEIYNKAIKREECSTEVQEFWNLQSVVDARTDLSDLQHELNTTIDYLKVGNGAKEVEDQILSIGERSSVRLISAKLNNIGRSSYPVDAREFIKVKTDGLRHSVDLDESEQRTKQYFKNTKNSIPVITGYIAQDQFQKTTTLGRNGTNLTATLVANFLNAEEVQNWTNIDGIYSANPNYVEHAGRIKQLSFKQAHELANFGASVLHPKTITPLLEKQIPIRILNSFNPNQKGTLISGKHEEGIKAVSTIENVALLTIEGKGLAGEIGIDGRIFATLEKLGISVRLISQASSERGIGFVVDSENADEALNTLREEFSKDLKEGKISDLSLNPNIAIIAIVGRHNYALEKAIYGLRRNRIWMHLISNSISGEHISLVVDKSHLKKAVNVVYNQVFGAIKTINVFAFGKGVVGAKLLDQITNTSSKLIEKRGLNVRLIGVADSTKYLVSTAGLGKDWKDQLSGSSLKSDIGIIKDHLLHTGLENIVIVDNTSSEELTSYYSEFLKAGFDLVASNKKANSGPQSYYDEIRSIARKKGRYFFYETNVGAGLPIIDTLKHLHDSADVITKVRGVFSGSLSYIFNNYSEQHRPFYEVLLEAKDQGFTEPDPREDLNGLDVARKLIILAREIGLKVELDQIQVQNLIPESLRTEITVEQFLSNKQILNSYYQGVKDSISDNQVLRYVGELDAESGILTVELQTFEKASPLGGVKNADAIFEIFTEGYGEQPIVVQGAGAGGEVTARGVYSDIIRIGNLV